MNFKPDDYVKFKFFDFDGVLTYSYGFIKEDCGDYCYIIDDVDQNHKDLYSIDKDIYIKDVREDAIEIIKYPYWEN